MNKNTLMTADELATELRLNRNTITQLAKNGKLPHFKIGKQYRFNLQAVTGACYVDVSKCEILEPTEKDNGRE